MWWYMWYLCIFETLQVMFLITAYHGLIHSCLPYAAFVWGYFISQYPCFFSLQRKAIRIVYGLKYREDCRHVFKELNILTLPSTNIMQCLLYIKINESKYNPHSEINRCSTRNRYNICQNFL